MAKSAGLGQNYYMAGFDLSGDIGALDNWSTPVGVLSVTGIDKSAAERVQGLVDGQQSFNAWFALSFSVSQMGEGIIPEWGQMLTAGKRTDTEATNGATKDDSASTSAGASSVLHVFSFTGTNVTVTVQDSTNGSSWATLIAHTAADDVTSERKTVSGTVNRYLRVITAGTFSSAVFALSLRRGEAVDRVAYA